MPQKPAKARKPARIAGAKREAILAALAAGESDNAIGKRLRVDRETVGRLRSSEDGQRVLARVQEVGEATREQILDVSVRALMKGVKKLDVALDDDELRAGEIATAIKPLIQMLFAQKHEVTGKDGATLLPEGEKRSVVELVAGMYGYTLQRPGDGAEKPEQEQESDTGSND